MELVEVRFLPSGKNWKIKVIFFLMITHVKGIAPKSLRQDLHLKRVRKNL